MVCRRSIPAVALALLLTACAGSGTQVHVQPVPDESVRPDPIDPQKGRQIELDLVRGLLDSGQYYAALAHIEALRQKGQGPDLTLLEADARRHLGQQAQATALYKQLLGGPYEGQAYHGLGLMLAPTDLGTAIGYLRAAAQRRPTDVEIRNDLGYALMQSGRYSEALPELSTAAELAPTQLKSRNNLIILMLLTGNRAGVEQLARQAGTTPEAMRDLRAQADAIRREQTARAARGAG